jgi:uncharacterized membrane protein
MKMMLFITALLSGLVAGLFYAYSCSVNPGLRQLPDADYIRAMQSINIAIQNPAFFLSFMGLLLVYPATLYLYHKQCGTCLAFYVLATAAIIYYIGVFGITAMANVPLNEQLARINVSAANADELSAARRLFEQPWNAWHSVRTIASVLSFALTILSIFNNNKP